MWNSACTNGKISLFSCHSCIAISEAAGRDSSPASHVWPPRISSQIFWGSFHRFITLKCYILAKPASHGKWLGKVPSSWANGGPSDTTDAALCVFFGDRTWENGFWESFLGSIVWRVHLETVNKTLWGCDGQGLADLCSGFKTSLLLSKSKIIASFNVINLFGKIFKSAYFLV